MSQQLTEVAGSMNDHIERVSRAWRKHCEGALQTTYSYVSDVFPDHVIVANGDWGTVDRKYYKVAYTATDTEIIFAEDKEEVALTYAPVSAAPQAEASTDPDPNEAPDAEVDEVSEAIQMLVEASEGKAPEAVIVVEGVSANGRVYTTEALQTGIGVFSGAKMYADHPSASEERERPERSVRDLVGKLGEAYMGTDRNGKPALRAPLIFSETADWLKTLVKEGIADGLSIRATGKGKQDKTGNFIVESFVANPFTSVDFVTVPAAGGYADLREARRKPLATKPEELAESQQDEAVVWLRESGMNAEQVKALKEAHDLLIAENTKLFKVVRTAEASRVLSEVMDKSLPTVAQERISGQAKTLIEGYATHGNQDKPEQLKARFKALVEAEKAYLAKIIPNGVVYGLQGNTAPDPSSILTEAFRGIVSDEQLAIAVAGRS